MAFPPDNSSLSLHSFPAVGKSLPTHTFASIHAHTRKSGELNGVWWREMVRSFTNHYFCQLFYFILRFASVCPFILQYVLFFLRFTSFFNLLFSCFFFFPFTAALTTILANYSTLFFVFYRLSLLLFHKSVFLSSIHIFL